MSDQELSPQHPACRSPSRRPAVLQSEYCRELIERSSPNARRVIPVGARRRPYRRCISPSTVPSVGYIHPVSARVRCVARPSPGPGRTGQDDRHAHRRGARRGHRRPAVPHPRRLRSPLSTLPDWSSARTWSPRSTCRRSRTRRWTATRSGRSTSQQLPGHPAGLPGHPGRPHRHRSRCAPGTAARIMTGAPLPPGADVIVQVERTDGGADAVRIDSAPAPGVHVRTPRRGRHAPAAVVLPAGHGDRAAADRGGRRARLRRTPGAPAAAGAGAVHRQRAGRTRAAARTGPDLRVERADAGRRRSRPIGARATHRALRRRRRRRSCAAALAGAADDVDLIVTSGGVSAGAYEVVKDALTGQGIEFAKVAMQPGMPQGAGRYGSPGRRCRSSRCRAIRSVRTSRSRSSCGRRSGPRWVIRTSPGRSSGPRSTAAIDSPAGKRQFRRGHLDTVAGTVAPWGGPGSHLLSWLAGADCMIVIAEDVTHLDAGSRGRGLAAGLTRSRTRHPGRSAASGYRSDTRDAISERPRVPEGHTIHRLARDLLRAFGRRPVAASTLQDRFAASAALLDGATLTRTDAHGKHLFLIFRAHRPADRLAAHPPRPVRQVPDRRARPPRRRGARCGSGWRTRRRGPTCAGRPPAS